MTLRNDNDHAFSSGARVVASGQSNADSLYLSALFSSGTFAGQSDGEVLARFSSRGVENDNETAELAFATLVSRHGAMVLRVCRAVLGDRHEAEDAFQATFLVLATRAGSIRKGGSVASWLHGVALRVAARAKSRAAQRRRHERKCAGDDDAQHQTRTVKAQLSTMTQTASSTRKSAACRSDSGRLWCCVISKA